MDELPSTEFRRQFARLSKVTTVTVNGHPIGVWYPGPPERPASSVRDMRSLPPVGGSFGRPRPAPKP